MRYHELTETELVESPEMQQGLEAITRLLLADWTRRIHTYLDPSRFKSGEFEIYDLAAGTFDEPFKNGKNLKKLPERLRAFIKHMGKTHFRIAAFPKQDTTNGVYVANRKEIILYFPQAAFDERKEQILNGNTTITHAFLETRHSALLHELVHAYDDFASKGNYTNNQTTASYARLSSRSASVKDQSVKNHLHTLYLKLQHEINARYAQAVHAIWNHRRLPWPEYRSRFTNSFVGWHVMTPEVKTRLLKRLATEWTKDRGRAPTDIGPYIKKLNDQVRAQFKDAWIAPAHGNIEVEGLDRIPSQAQTMILQQAVRLADIFRCQVVTDVAVPGLKAFGFVANKGRNKDYRISAPFRRDSRRA